jgi:hypothetical protein
MHSFYADDVALIICDQPQYLQQIQSIFDNFGAASGLFVDWRKTKGAFISSQPLPQRLQQLRWEWESPENSSKLLGFPVAESVSLPRMQAMVTEKLESKLQVSRKNPMNLAARVVVANHLLLSSIWYWLTLWPGTLGELSKLQTKVVKFIWAGQKLTARHRVDAATLCRPKHEGGLRLLSIPAETAALSGKILLWALHEPVSRNILRDLLRY